MFSKTPMVCYSGMSPDGRLILTPEFKRVCERYGYRDPDRGVAFDAAPKDLRNRGMWPPPPRNRALDVAADVDDPRDKYYRELEAEYAKLRGKPSAGSWRNLESVSEKYGMTDPRDHARETAKRGGCWNREQKLQQAYDDARKNARGGK